MASRKLLSFGPRLLNVVHSKLPSLVVSENGLVGGNGDGHQAEATVQQLIVRLLAPHVPAPELIANNVMALEDESLGRCIPDVTIHRVGGDPWGHFELKTLLAQDSLTEEAVLHDLRKLMTYKKQQPDAAAVFLLVGTRKRLSEDYARSVWTKAGLSAERAAFATSQLRPVKLFDPDFIAIPCGWSGQANEVMTMSWEIQPAGTQRIQSDTYRFLACMAGAA